MNPCELPLNDPPLNPRDLPPNDPALNRRELPLNDRIERALMRSPHLNNRRLRFETAGDTVVLPGVVHTYYHKQLAQESVKSVPGVSHIDNRIEVLAS